MKWKSLKVEIADLEMMTFKSKSWILNEVGQSYFIKISSKYFTIEEAAAATLAKELNVGTNYVENRDNNKNKLTK